MPAVVSVAVVVVLIVTIVMVIVLMSGLVGPCKVAYWPALEVLIPHESQIVGETIVHGKCAASH